LVEQAGTCMNDVTGDKPNRSLKSVFLRWLAVPALLALGVGVWMVYCGVTASLEAENNLHATLFTISLVEQFVAEKGRWPHSWDELEKLPVSGGTADLQGHDWPGASTKIRRHVSIDFSADPREIARQDPMSFTAIKPVGRYYEYRDHGNIQSLQETIRKAMKKVPPE